MDIDKLKTELAGDDYTGLTDQQAADLLNDVVVASKQPISSHDIKRYLTLAGKRSVIAADPNGATATFALDDFDDFDVADQEVEAALIAVLDGLIDAGLLVADDKTAILAMGDTLISRATQLGLPRVKPGHVQEARG